MRCGSLLIGITLIAVLAGCQGPRRTAVEAQDAAVAWMIEHQNPDGSWGTIDASRPYQIYLDTCLLYTSPSPRD